MNGILSSIQQQLMTFNSVPIWPLVINLIIGLLLALIIRWHLRRFDDRDDTIEALYYINIVDSDKLSALT